MPWNNRGGNIRPRQLNPQSSHLQVANLLIGTNDYTQQFPDAGDYTFDDSFQERLVSEILGSTRASFRNTSPDHRETVRLLENEIGYNPLNFQSNSPPMEEDFFDLDIEAYYANGNNACGFIPGVPIILSSVDEQYEDNLRENNSEGQSATQER